VSLKVLVVGAGIGGLCLAQGLRSAGIEVRVFERERGPSAAVPYRLRLDEQGLAALARCLPADLMDLFHATCNAAQAPRVTILDHNLEPLLSWGTDTSPARSNAVTNRQTLREILLTGLGDIVEYGREVVRVEDKGDAVYAGFADGGIEAGDLLVAADGVDSLIRTHVLPGTSMVDTGLWGVYGQASLDETLRRTLPGVLFGGSAPILGPDGLTLVVGVWQPRITPQRAAAELASQARLSHVDSCIQWTMVGPSAVLGTDPTPADPLVRLHEVVTGLTAGWHHALREMIGQSTVGSFFPIRAAVPVPAWPSTRITLLGDAIHATTAVGGTGANTAIRDAALLSERLSDVAAGRVDLSDAVPAYEDQMREYGFAASVRSLRSAEQIFRVYIPELS
jgi:2-polyprenyl-6-methoxyphenol hydroxylase-like FAD-dependent oxidoreductase